MELTELFLSEFDREAGEPGLGRVPREARVPGDRGAGVRGREEDRADVREAARLKGGRWEMGGGRRVLLAPLLT